MLDHVVPEILVHVQAPSNSVRRKTFSVAACRRSDDLTMRDTMAWNLALYLTGVTGVSSRLLGRLNEYTTCWDEYLLCV